MGISRASNPHMASVDVPALWTEGTASRGEAWLIHMVHSGSALHLQELWPLMLTPVHQSLTETHQLTSESTQQLILMTFRHTTEAPFPILFYLPLEQWPHSDISAQPQWHSRLSCQALSHHLRTTIFSKVLSTQKIQLWHFWPDFLETSSPDMHPACCMLVKKQQLSIPAVSNGSN